MKDSRPCSFSNTKAGDMAAQTRSADGVEGQALRAGGIWAQTRYAACEPSETLDSLSARRYN
jgi:hypothetical protein